MDNCIQTRVKWVDVAKFAAIFAVMIDHTNGILYTNPQVAWFSYYSVSLFVIVMGITTMWSYDKKDEALFITVRNKCLGIIRPYVVATVIYAIFVYRSFDFDIILNHLIRFNMSAPFYYVLLYIQLTLFSPILFFVFENARKNWGGYAIEVVTFFVVLCIGSWTTNHSNILGVYGGGGKLFGGSYLILFYIGMWIGKYYKRMAFGKIASGVAAFVVCGFSIAWWQFIAVDRCRIDSRLPYGGGFNPPSISLGLYAFLVAAMLLFLEQFLLNWPNGVPSKIMEAFAFLGRHTLYIFLYHRLFIDVLLPNTFSLTGITIENMWFKRIVYFVFMIGGSMLIEFALEKLHKKLLISYKVK